MSRFVSAHAELFDAEFGHEPHSFWIDGPLTWMGCADQVATFRVGDGVRIDGELVATDLWAWLDGLDGDWVGYLGYGVKAVTRGGAPHPASANPTNATPEAATPDALWMRVARSLRVPTPTEEATAPTTPQSGPFAAGDEAERVRYLAAIEQIRGHLARGESYEVCLTRSLTLAPVPEPLLLFDRLRDRFPTGKSVYLRSGDVAVVSATPEEFLTVSSQGQVSSSPIKGTAPRHRDPDLDGQAAQALAADAKTRAENLMIVDLVRNDLHQVCEPDSVEVPRFLSVESYPGVHQLVSTVTGRLRPECSRIDAIRAAFPPGSMTGSPKERTMRIIDALEPTPRGIYSGVIGVLGADGSADLRVVIRTAVCTPASVTLGIGGAITWGSDSAAEWDETVLKAQAVLAAHADVGENDPHG